MTTKTAQPIVSSAHLAQGGSPALSELEFSLTLAAAAFQRWMSRCAAAAGAQLSPLEVLILHTVRHRDRPKRFVDIMLVLHIEDAHLANYAVRKLDAAGLVRSHKVGKEKLVEATEAGVAFCDSYKRMREALLVEGLADSGLTEDGLSQSAARLRTLSGIYNEAARAAATF
ncbi:MAG TPA: winged helix DNA-binding protein [Caulobacter sp.]|nr:winged helix DNA-binding protein [Caulobacter sp.]HWW25175.1 winged helix DNA-binding protein [Caulobacter sp.]